jgi:MraZ protein
MFLGTYTPKLDEKGRIILPAKFRDQLAGGVVLTRGQERCLYVFSLRDFESMHETLSKAPLTSKESRDYQRLFLSGASDEQLDKQNRLMIPAVLRDYAGLDRDLAVIGMGSRLEIWNAQSWSRYVEEQEPQYSDVAEEVIPGLF